MLFLGKLDIKLVKFYTAQLVHTLEYLQKNEIMHRDLKPQNLMLDENYNIKVVSILNNFLKHNDGNKWT